MESIAESSEEHIYFLDEPPFSVSPLTTLNKLRNNKVCDKVCDLIEVEDLEVDLDDVNVSQKKHLSDILYVRCKINNKLTRFIPMMKPVDYFEQPREIRKTGLLRKFMYLNKLSTQDYPYYVKLITMLHHNMTISELLECVLKSYDIYIESELKFRINSVIKFMSSEVIHDPIISKMTYDQYLALTIFWLDICFAGGCRTFFDLEGDFCDPTSLALHGQNIWWFMHMTFLPLERLYQQHIATIVRPCIDYSDAPYPCCFYCGESFATEYWVMFTTEVQVFSACLDRFIVQSLKLSSIEDLPIKGSKTFQQTLSAYRWTTTLELFPTIIDPEMCERNVRLLSMTRNTGVIIKSLLDSYKYMDRHKT
jgi:hypothetical protein